MLRGVLGHVIEASLGVDRSAHGHVHETGGDRRGERLGQEVVDDAGVVDLRVDDAQGGLADRERPDVAELAAPFGIEERAPEHERRSPAVLGQRRTRGLERGGVRVGPVQLLGGLAHRDGPHLARGRSSDQASRERGPVFVEFPSWRAGAEYTRRARG